MTGDKRKSKPVRGRYAMFLEGFVNYVDNYTHQFRPS